VVLAFKPNSFWGGLGATEQFLLLLGLAFGVAAIPSALVQTGLGVSSLSEDSTNEEESRQPTQGPRRVA